MYLLFSIRLVCYTRIYIYVFFERHNLIPVPLPSASQREPGDLLFSIRLVCFCFSNVATLSPFPFPPHPSASQTRESDRNELVASDGRDLGKQLFDGEGVYSVAHLRSFTTSRIVYLGCQYCTTLSTRRTKCMYSVRARSILGVYSECEEAYRSICVTLLILKRCPH